MFCCFINSNKVVNILKQLFKTEQKLFDVLITGKKAEGQEFVKQANVKQTFQCASNLALDSRCKNTGSPEIINCATILNIGSTTIIYPSLVGTELLQFVT